MEDLDTTRHHYYPISSSSVTLKRKIRDSLPDSVRPFVIETYRSARSHSAVTRLARRRLARTLRYRRDLELLAAVDPTIAWSDAMFDGDAQAYLWAGLDAIRCIDAALANTSTAVEHILDLPSGWGRVIRFLKVRFPDAKITASDIIPGSAEYCAEHFGTAAVRSRADFDELNFPTKFDLIFVGSLITHLQEQNIRSLFRMFARSMTPHGLLVVTTLGDWGVMSLQAPAKGPDVFHDPARIDEGAAKYHASGYGFVNYAGQLGYREEEDEILRDSQYGVCFTSPSWIENVAADSGFHRVYFREHGWDDMQDVHGFQLNPQ